MPRLTLQPEELAKIGTPVPKGHRLSLGDVTKTPRRVVGAGWDPLRVQGKNADLDLVVAMLCRCEGDDPEPTESGLYVASRDRVVHYNPKARKAKVRDASGAVEYQGDSVDGTETDGGVDESVIVDFSKMPVDVVGLMTFVNIHKQDGNEKFILDLTFDQVNRPFVCSFPEGAENDVARKRVTSLDAFSGTDTVVIKFDWRQKDDTWEEEFVEKHVQHLPQFRGMPNAGFLSALVPYGVGV